MKFLASAPWAASFLTLSLFAAATVGCSRSQQTQAATQTLAPAPPAALAVRAEGGFVGIANPEQGLGPWLVPLHTRSERRVCAAAWMDEVEFLTTGLDSNADLVVQAVPHTAGTEVVQDERGLWELGEPLPWGHDFQIDPRPWMRRDGVVQSTATLQLPSVQSGQAWVLFPSAEAWFEPPARILETARGAMQRPAGFDSVWIVEPDEEFTIELQGIDLDALYLCEVRAIPHQDVADWQVEKVSKDIQRLPSVFHWQGLLGEGPARPFFQRSKNNDAQSPWHSLAQTWRVRLPNPTADSTDSSWTLLATLKDISLPSAGAQGSSRLSAIEKQTQEATANKAQQGWLRDATHTAGLDFLHVEGPDLQMDIRPTMGPGAAFGDFNGDGWQDLYLVQGGSREGWPALKNRLFENQKDGTFADVTSTALVGDTGAGMGALFFDADQDGDMDLYVANYGQDVLYQNQGDGTFTNVSTQAGLEADLWSASVAAADYDGDGDLDLYITSYLDYDLEKMPPADELERFQREDPVEMLPFAFPGQSNVLLRNDSKDGVLMFTDVAAELGVQNETGLSMQALWWDFDKDRDPDLYIANDVSPNVLFLNKGDGTFEDITFAAGLDDPRGGMGLDLGDVDQDGDEDVFLSNWQLESNALYLNQHSRHSANRTRRANFRDATVAAGLGPAGVGVTSWGVTFFDLELDGVLDLFIANGYTSPDYAQTGICVGQPNQLFLGQGRGRFLEANYESAGAALRVQRASRSSIPCDYDRDGDIDLLVTANNGLVQLLRNDAPRGQNRSLTVRLKEMNGNSFGIGARVSVQAGEQVWTQSMRAGMSYLSGNAPELVFGLGDHSGPVTVRVAWREGNDSEYKLPALDSTYCLFSDGNLMLVGK